VKDHAIGVIPSAAATDAIWIENAIFQALRNEGISGSDGLDERPGLAGALDELEQGTAGVLLVYRLDRLARDLILQETVLARVEAAGGRIVSVTEPDIDSGDPTRVLVRQVLGALAQYERAVIRARMTAGIERKRAAGGYAGGRPGFGRCADGRGDLVADQQEQATIGLILQLRTGGASLRQVAAELEARGVTTKTGGTRWHPHTIARIERANTSDDVSQAV
jgi:DNA invertase Pin-like site-specific DNA recombinase